MKKYNRGVAESNRRRAKHGQASRETGPTKLYHIWRSMKDRCLNNNSPAYHRYGGRGITMSSRWVDSFIAFERDIGPRPSLRHTLERIDNNKGYYPSNVRWATRAEQANNRATNRILEHDGKRMNVAQWAKHLDLPHALIRSRLHRGETVAEALRPRENRERNKTVLFMGERKTLTEWARILKVPYATVYWRYTNGKPLTE